MDIHVEDDVLEAFVEAEADLVLPRINPDVVWGRRLNLRRL